MTSIAQHSRNPNWVQGCFTSRHNEPLCGVKATLPEEQSLQDAADIQWIYVVLHQMLAVKRVHNHKLATDLRVRVSEC